MESAIEYNVSGQYTNDLHFVHIPDISLLWTGENGAKTEGYLEIYHCVRASMKTKEDMKFLGIHFQQSLGQ